MRRILLTACAPLLLVAAPAFAQKNAASDYDRDVISVATTGRGKIEAACAEDHAEPHVVYKMTRADQR